MLKNDIKSYFETSNNTVESIHSKRVSSPTSSSPRAKSPLSPSSTRKSNFVSSENKRVSVEKISCGSKRCERSAAIFCTNCDLAFCMECSDVIHALIDGHIRTPIVASSSCAKHALQIMSMCKTCKLFTCEKCLKSAKHKDHTIIYSEELAKECSHQLLRIRKKLQSSISVLAKSSADISSMMTKIEIAHDELDHDIEKKFKKLIDAASNRRDTLLQESRSIKQRKRKGKTITNG